MSTKKIIYSLIAITMATALPAFAEDKKSAEPNATAKGSDKVDLKKLEDKYWASKDDDYGVIQNRTFSKTGKFYGSLVYGPLMNDPFAKARAAGGMLGYYVNEDFGMEFSYLSYASKQNDTVTAYQNDFSAVPDYNLVKASKAISLTYTPFYAKMAFMNKAILYFDMGFTLGAGITDYEIQKTLTNAFNQDIQSNEMKSASHFELGIMQQLFLSQYFAFRLDVKNSFYQQTTQKYKATSEATRATSSKSANDTTITFGLTLFTK